VSEEWDQEGQAPQWERHKEEKDEKEEKHEDQHDPLGAVVGGMILIMLGIGLFAWTQGWIAGWAMALGLFFLGLAAIFVLEILIRLVLPAYRRGIGGRIISTLVVTLIGLGLLGFEFWGYDIWTFWPLILIAIGIIILVGAILGPLFRK